MKNKILFWGLVFMFFANFAFSALNEFRWGGPGYDPALQKRGSSRFLVREPLKDDTAITIWVDSQETVNEVGRMDLTSEEATTVSSDQCHKAMRHITAPWSCAFQKKALQKMSGTGTIQVFNRADKPLLKDRIHFDTIKSYLGYANPSSSKNKLIVPQKAGLYFIPSPQGNALPALVLTVFAGGGCDQAGPLQITKSFKANQPNIYTKGGRMDMLEIQIKGYNFKKSLQEADISCPAVLIESRATIELEKFMAKQRLQLRILLNGQLNIFDLNQYEGVVYLNPIESSQIISWGPGENMPEMPQGLGFMTKSFRERLAQVRLNGSYAHQSDLAARLRDYLTQAGYEPLDEKLQGYPPMNPLEEFIVFVPPGNEIPEDFTIIGEVFYHEMPAGEKSIDVGLMKKKALNPFFTR